MHYYKRNLGDYAKKTGRLSILQHGVYNLLIDACYDRERFPTMAEAIDWTWASTPEEAQAVEFVLARFFALQNDGTYLQQRVKEELDAYHETSLINKRIATEREARRNESSTKRARTVHEAPPNHEPLTKNQEPSLPGVSGGEPPKPGKPASKTRSSKRVPEGFTVSEDLQAWAKEKAPSVNWLAETEKFRDWEFKHARSDWAAVWRLWMRKAQESAGGTSPSSSRNDGPIV